MPFACGPKSSSNNPISHQSTRRNAHLHIINRPLLMSVPPPPSACCHCCCRWSVQTGPGGKRDVGAVVQIPIVLPCVSRQCEIAHAYLNQPTSTLHFMMCLRRGGGGRGGVGGGCSPTTTTATSWPGFCISFSRSRPVPIANSESVHDLDGKFIYFNLFK